MTLRTYRRIALYTVIALLGVMVLTIAGTLAAGVGCRGEGCGWLLLAPAFWAWLLLPPLTAALLGGFGICSGLRFSDIGLNGIFGAIPALLALRVVTVIDDLAGYPTLLFRYPLFALNIIPVCCTLICLYLLFFKDTGYLAAPRGAHPSTYKVTFVAATILAVIGVPYAALDFARSFGSGMFMYDGFPALRYLYDLTFKFEALYYLYVLLQAVVAVGLWMLIRAATSSVTPSAVDAGQ